MGKVILRILGALATVYLGIGIVYGVLVALGLANRLTADYATRMLANLALGAVATGLIFVYARRPGGVSPRELGLGWTARDAAFAAVAATVAIGSAWAYILLLGEFGMHPLTPVAPSWGLMAIGLLGQCGILYEELLFRGYLLALLRRHVGTGSALAVAAALFAAYHVPARGLGIMVASWLLGGLLYGYLYLRSGSLWVALSVHVAHNWAADLFLYGDNGVSLFRFATPLGGPEKLAHKLVLTLTLLALAWLVYGRGTRALAPSARLCSRWTGSLAASVPDGKASSLASRSAG
jgi:membrane protease YdiL (CAAX protease family)